MAAYGAAVSLLKTVSELLENPNEPQEHLQLLGNGVYTLRLFLENNREVKREFEIRIRDVIYEAQDMIDSYISSTDEHEFLSPSEAEIGIQQGFCQDLERLLQKYGDIAVMTAEEFNHQTLDREISNSIWKKSNEIKRLVHYPMVGRHQDFYQLKDRLRSESPELLVVPIVGDAGMGKSTLAKFLYKDQDIRDEFHICGRVTVPIEYKKRNVLLELLLDMRNLGDGFIQDSDDQIEKQVYDFVKHKKFLVLLDDIRDIEIWNDLKESLPDYHNGSRILLTTKNMDFARVVGIPHLLDRVSDEDTLTLLQKIVLDGEPYLPEFVIIAKGISASCRGIPHAAVIVGRLLRCAKLSAEYWEIVLSSCENYVDLMEGLVSLTYKHLPQQLKTCILYLAMFPYNFDVPFFKLLDLWIAEEFIKMDELWYTSALVELRYATDCHSHLYKRSLISYEVLEVTPPSTRIHEEVFHDFLSRTAKEEKFFLSINRDTDYGGLLEDEYGTCNQQRRLFITENIVPFVIHNNYSCESFSNVHSLLYYGPEHQYPLHSWLKAFRRLRVLDAFKIRFFHFPREILKSLQMRYLSLIYNKKLPPEVCRFRGLKSLIVSHYLSVKDSNNPSYLPPEVWNMKELSHLQVMGSDLPQPPPNTDLLLENLLTLLDVSAHSCNLQILERTPNLLDLGIQIDLLPKDDFLSFFSHLHVLKVLSVFKCVVMYPNIGSQVVPCSAPLSFPPGLSDLTLSGCGFPWKYMSAVAALRKLEILKLRNYAFQGPEWEMKKDEFPNLHTLILEDTDLKSWILPDESYFPMLRGLVVRHCYKLREIPYAIGDIPTLKGFEVNECSSSTMKSALAIKEKLSTRNGSKNFFIYSSRDG